MPAPKDIVPSPEALPAAVSELEGLSGVPLGMMTPEQSDTIKRSVVAAKSAGIPWTQIYEQWPLVGHSTMQNWWRLAKQAPIDPSPAGVIAARQRQAAEVRWLLEQTFKRVEKLEDDDTREGIETDTDRFTKLTTTADRLHKREAALLGLDAPVRMELDQRVKLDWAPELESLVAELAGGGLLQTDAGEILDGEVIE